MKRRKRFYFNFAQRFQGGEFLQVLISFLLTFSDVRHRGGEALEKTRSLENRESSFGLEKSRKFPAKVSGLERGPQQDVTRVRSEDEEEERKRKEVEAEDVEAKETRTKERRRKR